MGSRRRAVGAVIASVAFAVLAGPAEAAQVTEFPIAPGAAAGAHEPRLITQGPGGMLWFTDHADKSVGRVGTDGVFLPRIPTHDSRAPEDIAASADGWVYWTVDSDELEWRNPNGVVGYSALNSLYTYGVAVAADGTVFWTDRNYSPPMLGRVCKGVASTTCQVLPGQSSPPARQTDITLGPDGKWWVTGFEEDRVRRVTSGLDTDLAIDLPSGSHPYRIVWGPDDNMWATDYGASSLDRITTAGVRTRFPLPPGTGPNDIVTGPDGALWFTEFDAGRIGRLTTGGQFNDFPLPTPNSHPWGITVGPDGAIWFTEATSGNVGRLVLDQPGGGGAGGGGQITDTFAPRFLSPLALEPPRFHVGRTRTALVARRKTTHGSSLRFSVSEPATVAIAIERRTTGRSSGRRCVRRTRRNAGKRKCARFVRVGSLMRASRQGPNAFAFSGRIGHRKLAVGRYRAVAIARDAAGNSSAPSSAPFTIVAG